MEKTASYVEIGPFGLYVGPNWSFVPGDTYQSEAYISGMTIYSGDVVDCIDFEYTTTVGGKTFQVKFGYNDGSPNKIQIVFGSDEKIMGISGTYGDYQGVVSIISLSIVTNKKTYGPYGGSTGKTSFSVPIKKGKVVGFFGAASSHIDNIGVIIEPEENGYVEVGPWGGQGSNPWTFNPDGRISEIIFKTGDIVDSIKFVAVTAGGEDVKSVGGDGGDSVNKIPIPDDEYIHDLGGTYGEYYAGNVIIKSLSLNTNIQRYGPYGGTGETSFALPLHIGKIIGFFGTSGSYVDSIGAIIQPLDKTDYPTS